MKTIIGILCILLFIIGIILIIVAASLSPFTTPKEIRLGLGISGFIMCIVCSLPSVLFLKQRGIIK